MRIRVLWTGRPSGSPYEREVETYRRRVARRWPAEDLPLRPVRGGRDADPRRALREEAAAIRERIPAGWRTVLLDQAGTMLDSESFAAMLHREETDGTPGLVFVIGSDLGLDPGLEADAFRRISLGPLTLPHLLARLVLWEQLFRSADLLGGGSYHRRNVQWSSGTGRAMT